jgi:hypothetical protein
MRLQALAIAFWFCAGTADFAPLPSCALNETASVLIGGIPSALFVNTLCPSPWAVRQSSAIIAHRFWWDSYYSLVSAAPLLKEFDLSPSNAIIANLTASLRPLLVSPHPLGYHPEFLKGMFLFAPWVEVVSPYEDPRVCRVNVPGGASYNIS